MTPRQLVPGAVLVLLALAGVAWWHFSVRPSPLAAAEVRPLLTEHSALGAWGSASRRYLLYLGADGTARYREQDHEVLDGNWRVEPDGAVCLELGGGRANCYGVGREGADLVWILPGSGRTYPFELRPGQVEGL